MSNSGDGVLGRLRATLAQTVGQPSEAAHAMPAEYYTAPELLQAEIDDVLRREWMCVGHVGEIRGPGDFYTTELVEEQLIVTRDMDGQVRVLSNVCRHRRMRRAVGRAAGRAERHCEELSS